MDFYSLDIADIKILKPRRFADPRGYFSETYNERIFRDAGVDVKFVQDNQSFSAQRHTVRGLHYQSPPFAQAKLVRVLSGRIYDVAVDVRQGSATYGAHVGAELTAEKGEQIFVPAGFLHGFITLDPDTLVAYKVDNYYDKGSDGAVRFDDPDLAIDWAGVTSGFALSEKDLAAPSFKTFKTPFRTA